MILFRLLDPDTLPSWLLLHRRSWALYFYVRVRQVCGLPELSSDGHALNPLYQNMQLLKKKVHGTRLVYYIYRTEHLSASTCVPRAVEIRRRIVRQVRS